jgi:hypothetical protein
VIRRIVDSRSFKRAAIRRCFINGSAGDCFAGKSKPLESVNPQQQHDHDDGNQARQPATKCGRAKADAAPRAFQGFRPYQFPASWTLAQTHPGLILIERIFSTPASATGFVGNFANAIRISKVARGHPAEPIHSHPLTLRMCMDGLQNYFDRVVVVNLARRPERLEKFWSLLGDWPFKKPERFEAIEGQSIPMPAKWTAGVGAWGCQLSHRAVLDRALADGLKNVLVLEDDAYPVVGFAQQVQKFLRSVPNDWDCLMLGAQHLRPPIPITEGVVRCVASNRTHAFAVRGKFLKTIRDVWALNQTDHCDIVLSSMMRIFKAYAPDPLLIGQDGGESDVTNLNERLRFLAASQVEQIADHDPRHVLEKLLVRVPSSRHPLLMSWTDLAKRQMKQAAEK